MSIQESTEVSPGRGEVRTSESVRSASLQRRLLLAFHDLGIDKLLPPCWIQTTTIGLAFGDLTLSEADRLVLVLETLSERLVVAVTEPGPGQLHLFDPDA
jgi:hypothetical protein